MSGRSCAEQSSRTDWFRDAAVGACMHFLPRDAATLAQVFDADVESLAEQLHWMGAKYLVFTLGQNSGWFNAPNAVYDRIVGYQPGERCSQRDLPLDLHLALQPRGIRLMLYLPCQPPNRDAMAQKAFGLPQGPKDQPLSRFSTQRWAEVIHEWSACYGDRVCGWWFDGAYQHIHFSEETAGVYADAVRQGNADAIVAFNPGVKLIHHMQAEDYIAGELEDPFDVVPASRWVGGSQWHALTYLGSSWSKRDVRHSTRSWRTWVKTVISREGVVTLDVGPNWDPKVGPIAAISQVQAEQFRDITQL